jgi:hypothetical protein
MENLLLVLLFDIFGIEFFNTFDFFELLVRFSFNMFVSYILIRQIYFKATNRKDYLFTYILISIVVFLLCFLLESVKLELGFALGLFAIFGIIRYRTKQMPIREMTYLFLIIGISVINALANKKISYAELLLTNALIIFITLGLERFWLLRHEMTKKIIYEKIDLIRPENHKLLKEDLERRTGLKISRFEIGRINFLKDTTEIKIYYYDNTSRTIGEDSYNEI